jgi:hypothetical protein
MEEKLRYRIQRVATEIQAINREFERVVADSNADWATSIGQRELLDTYKHSIDRTRHLVWPFILGNQQHAEQNAGYLMQVYRMKRIREMLIALRTQQEQATPSDSVTLFLAEIQRMLASA